MCMPALLPCPPPFRPCSTTARTSTLPFAAWLCAACAACGFQSSWRMWWVGWGADAAANKQPGAWQACLPTFVLSNAHPLAVRAHAWPGLLHPQPHPNPPHPTPPPKPSSIMLLRSWPPPDPERVRPPFGALPALAMQFQAVDAGLRDAHPYVREAAVMGVLKCFHQDPAGAPAVPAPAIAACMLQVRRPAVFCAAFCKPLPCALTGASAGDVAYLSGASLSVPWHPGPCRQTTVLHRLLANRLQVCACAACLSAWTLYCPATAIPRCVPASARRTLGAKTPGCGSPACCAL